MENRRTSILKRNAAMMEESNAINRRVSFHNVRTVQRFDVENFEYQEPQRERFHLSTSDEGSALQPQEDKTIGLFKDIAKRRPDLEQSANSTMNFLNGIPQRYSEDDQSTPSGSDKTPSSGEGMELSSVEDILSPPKNDDTMAMFENMGHKSIMEANGEQSFGDISIPAEDDHLTDTMRSETVLREIVNVSASKKPRQMTFEESDKTMDVLLATTAPASVSPAPARVENVQSPSIVEPEEGTQDILFGRATIRDEVPSAERTHVISHSVIQKSVIADVSTSSEYSTHADNDDTMANIFQSNLCTPNIANAFTPTVFRRPATNASFNESSLSAVFSEQANDVNMTEEISLLPEMTFASIAPANNAPLPIEAESVILEDEHIERTLNMPSTMEVVADVEMRMPAVQHAAAPVASFSAANDSMLTELNEIIDVSMDNHTGPKPPKSFAAPYEPSARKSDAPRPLLVPLHDIPTTPMATPMRPLKCYTPFTPAHRFRKREAFVFESPQRDPTPLPRLTLKSQKFMDQMKTMEFDLEVLVPSVKPSEPIPTQTEMFGPMEGKDENKLLEERIILTVLTALRGDKRLLNDYLAKENAKRQVEVAPMRQQVAELEAQAIALEAKLAERKIYREQVIDRIRNGFQSEEEKMRAERLQLVTQFYEKCMAARAALDN